MADLATSAVLFEVSLPEYKQLKTCRREMQLLKELWDMITLVRAVVWEPRHSAQRCFQARAAQQAALGWHGHLVQDLAQAPGASWALPAKGAELLLLLRELIAIRGRMRHGAGCYTQSRSAWFVHVRESQWAHRACKHWPCCSSSRAGMPLLIPFSRCENVSWVQVNLSIATWNTTRWADLNVEDMDLECKKFAKDIRSLDKELKSWDAFTGLDSNMKNMMTSLRAVSELQNPAIRDRHWQELVQTTKVLPSPPGHPWPRRLQPLAQEAPKIHTQQGKGAIRFKSGHTQIFI